jgi:hypothetical protein
LTRVQSRRSTPKTLNVLMMKSINSIQLKNKISLENLNVTKIKKKKKLKARRPT